MAITFSPSTLGKVTAALVLSTALFATGISGAQAYGGAPSVSVSDTTPTAGGTVTVTIKKLEPGEKYTLKLDGDTVGSSTATTTSFKAPKLAGKYSLVLRITSGEDKSKTSTTSITVGTVLKSVTATNKSSVKKNKSLKVSGKISSKKSGASISIYYGKSKSGSFKKVGSDSTSSSGAYSDTIKINKKGTFYIKTVVKHDGKFTSVTKYTKVTVK